MSILLFILAIIFAFIILAFSLIRRILSFLFGGLVGRSSNSSYSGSAGSSGTQSDYSTGASEEDKKVFSNTEGEYVSYEEVE